MDMVFASINEYWQLIQTHGVINFVLFLVSLYFVPFAFKTVLWMIKNLLGPVFRVLFNDLIERKIKAIVSAELSKLTRQRVIANDIPHLESDYLYLYKIVISGNEFLQVEFPTIVVRVRFWRLLGKLTWNAVWHCRNSAKKLAGIGAIMSAEVKEVKLENPTVVWKIKDEACTACAVEDQDDKPQHIHHLHDVLDDVRHALNQYELHFAIDRGAFKVNIRDTYYSVENISGYIHSNKEKFQLYFLGLYDGQVISFANEDKEGQRFHLVVPGCTITPALWEIITDNIPSLQAVKPSAGDAIGRITELHCRFSIEQQLELLSLDWQIRDGKGEYSHGNSHSYKFTAGEGSFHIDSLKVFTVSKFSLKVNNHAIGWSGRFVFDKPLDSKQNLKTNSSSFELALDSNDFSFANSLSLAVLDRFCLKGNMEMLDGGITLNFDSDNETELNSLAVQYKKLRLLVNRFYGDISISKDAVNSQSLGCCLISVSVGDGQEAETSSDVKLKDVNLNLLTQDFSMQALVQALDVPAYYKSVEFFGKLDGDVKITGNLSQANSTVCMGSYAIKDIVFTNKFIDVILPKTISGNVYLDKNGLNADAIMNNSIKIPCRIVKGKFVYEGPALVKAAAKAKYEAVKTTVVDKVTEVKAKFNQLLGRDTQGDEKALPGPEEQAEADAKELVTSEPKKEEGILAKVKSFFKFGKE